MNTHHKALTAVVALSAALALTAVPASASTTATTPPTLASALAALKAAEAQVTTAIDDKPAAPGAAWDAQMKAALAAEAAAEAQLRPLLVPPSTTDFGVTYLFDYKAHGLTYKVQLAPGSADAFSGTNTRAIDLDYFSGTPCVDRTQYPTGVCYGTFTAGQHDNVSGVAVDLGFSEVTTWVPGDPIPPSVYIAANDASIVGSNAETYHPVPTDGDPTPAESVGITSLVHWEIVFALPKGVTVAQVKWSNVDPNGETTTAVWNV